MGEDIAVLARQYTLRSSIAKRGGEFGFFIKGTHGKLGEIAFQKNVGDLVGPLVIAGGPPHGGFSIFQVIGKMKSKKIPFSSVQLEIKQKLLSARRNKVIVDFTSDLKDKTKLEIKMETLKKIKTIDDYNIRPFFFFPVTNF